MRLSPALVVSSLVVVVVKVMSLTFLGALQHARGRLCRVAELQRSKSHEFVDTFANPRRVLSRKNTSVVGGMTVWNTV